MPPISRPASIRLLVTALSSASAPERESAVARLTLVGALAAPKVAALAARADALPTARVAALRVLAGIGGRPAIDAASAALASDDTAIVEQACELLGAAAREPSPNGTRALDRLTGIALSTTAAVEGRLAAISALEGLPERLIRPVYEALARDISSRVVSRVARRQGGSEWSLDTQSGIGLPGDPALVLTLVREEADGTPVTALRRATDEVKARESDAGGEVRGQWAAVRAALHEALARRGSRIALYDLRETFESAREQLPIGFLSAAAAVGDASCLEGVAAAWDTADAGDRWYREHLADVFAAIVRREAITREHPVLKKLLTRRPGAAALVALAPRPARPRR